MNKQAGFTLIEALVALVIAATSMMALMGRLGASADIQSSLVWQQQALELASDQLASLSLQDIQKSEKHGSIERGNETIEWRSWTQKTMLDGFVRINVQVQKHHEPAVSLFLYRALP